jgi:hypothetical protein
MNIRYLWILMATISTVLFMFQASIDALSPQASTLYVYEGSIIEAYDDGNYNLKIDANEGIPELSKEVTTDSDGGFTDIFQAIKSWFQDTKAGRIINSLYYSVPNTLKQIGVPSEFSFALGVLWVLLSVFSFVMFMRGL